VNLANHGHNNDVRNGKVQIEPQPGPDFAKEECDQCVVHEGISTHDLPQPK